MAEKMFESIIVVREGHALTIMIQCEKHPSFCAHCRSIGHNIQACSKVKDDLTRQTHKKASYVKQKTHSTNAFSNKEGSDIPSSKAVETTSSKGTHHHNVSVGNKSDKLSTRSATHEVPFESTDDFEEGEVSSYDTQGLENIERHHNKGDFPTLSLQNSFGILISDIEQGTGEAIPQDKESTPIIWI